MVVSLLKVTAMGLMFLAVYQYGKLRGLKEAGDCNYTDGFVAGKRAVTEALKNGTYMDVTIDFNNYTATVDIFR